MRTTSKIAASALLLAVVIHPCATALHAGLAVSIGQNFTGTSSSQASSSNPSGAVGPNHFVEFNQTQFAVYNKSDGSQVQWMWNNDFWTSAGVTNNAIGAGPRVVFDPTVQRWFVAQILAPNMRVAVSDTADPTGTWHGVTLPDRPGSTSIYHFNITFLGLDAQGVYLSSVVLPASGTAYVPTGTALWSLPKADLLSVPLIITNRTWFGQLFATNYGYSLAPAIALDGSRGGNVLATAGTGVNPTTGNPQTNNNLVALDILNAGGPGAAMLGPTQTVVAPPYTEPINNALQPDGSSNLADWDAEMTAQVYRVDNVLFAAQAIQLGPRVAVRWYRLSAINHALLESGTITDPNLDLYYPSIAANTNGAVVLSFNGSGSNAFVSCYAAVGQTLNGVTTFGNPLLLQGGLASYQNLDSGGYNEWGSYSTTCPDPTDPNVFWTINAYAAGPTTWATQITQLLTSPSPQIQAETSGADLLLSWPVTTVPFQLLSASTLTVSPVWSPVTQPPTTNGAIVSVRLTPTNGSAFFRLGQSQ